MISMIFLLMILSILLIISCTISYRNILLTPQVAFVGGFTLSVAYGLLWVKTWDLNLHPYTFLVLAGGAALFVGISLIVQRTSRSANFKVKHLKILHYNASETNNGTYIKCETWKLVVFLCFQLFVIAWVILFLSSLGQGNIALAMRFFRKTNQWTDEKIALPYLLRVLRTLTIASGYFWGYLLAHSIIYKYKTKRGLLLANIICSILSFALLGSRTAIFEQIISFFVCLYVLYTRNRSKRIRIKPKIVIKILLIFFAFIISFQWLGNLMGRGNYRDFFEYIAIYLSAEIKNLDTIIRERSLFYQGTTMATTLTMGGVANFLSGKFGLPNWSHTYTQNNRFINGHALGNVSTCYFVNLYDGGIPAVFIYTALMAFLSAVFTTKAFNPNKNKKDAIDLSIIIYGRLYFCWLFSFFGNKFYGVVFDGSFLYALILWSVLKYFVLNVRVRKRVRTHSIKLLDREICE